MKAAAGAAGVSRRTGWSWLAEAGGVRPRVSVPELEAAVAPGSGGLSFVDRCLIEDLVKARPNVRALLGIDLIERPALAS